MKDMKKKPNWLSPEIERVFDVEVKNLPNGLRMIKLTSKKKRLKQSPNIKFSEES